MSLEYVRFLIDSEVRVSTYKHRINSRSQVSLAQSWNDQRKIALTLSLYGLSKFTISKLKSALILIGTTTKEVDLSAVFGRHV